MLDTIRALFAGRPAADVAVTPTGAAAGLPAGVDPVHLAACALLLDVAHADGELSARELSQLKGVLARQFGLTPEEGDRLLALAEEARTEAVDHFGFVAVLQQHYDTGQKMVLAEVMWGIALADGSVADHEHYLARKIANLLNLDPGYLATAKAEAARRLREDERADG